MRSGEEKDNLEKEADQEIERDKVTVLKLSSLKNRKLPPKGGPKSPSKGGPKYSTKKPILPSVKGSKHTFGKKTLQNRKHLMVEDKTPERELSAYEKNRQENIVRSQKVIKDLELEWDVLGKPIM